MGLLSPFRRNPSYILYACIFLAVNHLYDPLGFSSGMVINNFCHNNKIQQVFFPKEVVFPSLSLVYLTGLQFQISLVNVNGDY